jgi:chromatin structure-remodeling complex protein RSC7
MLAIDAARTSGFRDSLYYFRRNALALKLNATQAEKDYLISEGKLGSHLRTRSVTLVTARSAFKLHGSKMLLGACPACRISLRGLICMALDGRWVVDDYYEDKVLEEITAKGLKPGDLVGELPDPNAPHHTGDPTGLGGAGGAGAGKAERGSGGGVYRAGGPTTIFGGSGLGPFSDGPLNAVRKSLLSRDGVTEENWMYMMASRVLEAGEEWAKCRKESLKAWAGLDGFGGGDGTPQPIYSNGKGKEAEEEEEADDKDNTEQAVKRRKVADEKDERPLGVYEPHIGLVQCEHYPFPSYTL